MACIDFQTEPSRYRHWKLRFDGPVAHLIMDVDPQGGLFEGYELKLNSYDLGVDIELEQPAGSLRRRPSTSTPFRRRPFRRARVRAVVWCATAMPLSVSPARTV